MQHRQVGVRVSGSWGAIGLPLLCELAESAAGQPEHKVFVSLTSPVDALQSSPRPGFITAPCAPFPKPDSQPPGALSLSEFQPPP